MTRAERAEEASRHHRQFSIVRDVCEVRDFQLVLCADVWDRVGEYTVRVLKKAVAVEKAIGMFNGFSSNPIVTHTPRATQVDWEEELFAAEPPLDWTPL